MASLSRNHGVPRLAASFGVVAQIASAYVFLLYPALTVPSPERYGFIFTWVALVGLTAAWWRDHPWRSLTVPLVSVPTCALVLWFGTQVLRWGP
jgi:hypothetical protein